MFGLARRRRDALIAVVVVEDGAASVALMSADGGVHMHERAEKLSEGGASLSLEKATAGIREAGARMMDTYVKNGMHAPISTVYCFVHEPYFSTSVSQAVRMLPEDTKVDGALVKEVFRSACENAEQMPQGELLEAGLLKIELNGYPTSHPIGQYAHKIEVSAVLSSGSAELKKLFSSAIWSAFPAASISWRSGIRSILAIERASATRQRNYVAVVVGASATYITAIDNEHIVAHHSVAEGMQSLLMRAGGGKSPQETASYFRMIGRDACEGETCNTILASLAKSEPELVRIFGETFSKLSIPRRMPNDILLVAQNDMAGWLTKFLARIDFSQFTITTQPFNVEVLTQKNTDTLISASDTVQPLLAVACAYTHHELSD